ncbi:hypothetical protein [Adhaeribacter terreus]|uniref:STAS/SEC14 domain-containing protein n=1 Tax=Adhaeribacter terreus TaxID=529703 RepID=A0ABW0E4I3_9BACT
MPDSALEKPNFTVCYEPNNSLLRVSWQGLVSEEELKIGYETVLNLLRESPVNRILIDFSKRKIASQSNPQSLFGEIFLEALHIIGNTVFLALVVSQEEYFLTTAASRFENFHQADNHYVITEQFLTKAEAEAWLAEAC